MHQNRGPTWRGGNVAQAAAPLLLALAVGVSEFRAEWAGASASSRLSPT